VCCWLLQGCLHFVATFDGHVGGGKATNGCCSLRMVLLISEDVTNAKDEALII